MSDYLDFWYTSADSLRLYARDYPCTDTTSAEPETVLCMHGLTRNSADFHSLAQHLASRYRVISVDQRGRGRSQYDSDPARYTPATYVRDMFTLLDKLGVGRAILIGTSMGGLMSLVMGAMAAQRVEAIVLNDIGPEVDSAGLDRIRSYVGKSRPVHSWADAVAQAREINGVAFPDFSDDEWLEFARGVYREENGVPVLAYDPAISGPMDDEDSDAVPDDLWPLFDAAQAIPMLVIRGETSDILARDCVARMQSRKRDLQVTEVPRRGHAPTLNEPVSRDAIDRFLRALPAPVTPKS